MGHPDEQEVKWPPQEAPIPRQPDFGREDARPSTSAQLSAVCHGVQGFQLGLDPWSRCRLRKWKQKVQDATYAARTAMLDALATSGLQDGSSRGDTAYMQRAPGSQALGRWGLGPSWCQPLAPGSTLGGSGCASWKALQRWLGGGSPGPQTPSAGKYVRMPLSGPPALGVRRQDPVWSWTAPNTNMALYAQQPGLGPLVVGRQGLVQ